MVSAHNRYFAELQAKHPSVFCFATTLPWGRDRFLREFERAVKHDGLKHPPSHYLKMMYLESTCYHLPTARCAYES